MAKGPASGKNDAEILDYRHDRARRKNNPPAVLVIALQDTGLVAREHALDDPQQLGNLTDINVFEFFRHRLSPPG
jgi:hypothetical protein